MSQKFKPGWVYSYPARIPTFVVCIKQNGECRLIGNHPDYHDKPWNLTGYAGVKEEFPLIGPEVQEFLERLTTTEEE